MVVAFIEYVCSLTWYPAANGVSEMQKFVTRKVAPLEWAKGIRKYCVGVILSSQILSDRD